MTYAVAVGDAEWIEAELEKCRAAYEAGISVALIDALWLSKERHSLTPEWVLEASLHMAQERASATLPGTKGRTANPLAAYRAEMMHFDRWAAVRYARDVQVRDRKAGPEPVRYNLTGAKRPGTGPEVLEPGLSWPVAYRRAAALLRGSQSQGTAVTMKKSYERVERDMKSGHAMFHIPISPVLMQMLEDGQGKK